MVSIAKRRTLPDFNDYLPASTLVGDRTKKQDRTKEDNKTYERDTVRFPIKIKEGEHIVLNHADTAQLKKVPGIGSYYAREILRYGKWLGGYVHIDQLDEIKGFPQEAKKYFVIQSASPKKLNVNRLSLAELRRHRSRVLTTSVFLPTFLPKP